MQSAFLTVVVVVGVVGLLGALIALALGRGTWESLDRDRLLMESDLQDPRARRRGHPEPDTADAGEREAEIRQMLEALGRRRRRRGEPEVDIEAELERCLHAPGHRGRGAPAEPDPELVAEIRELVLARNHRRVRRGRPPLDVEAEVERQIARLTG